MGRPKTTPGRWFAPPDGSVNDAPLLVPLNLGIGEKPQTPPYEGSGSRLGPSHFWQDVFAPLSVG